MVKVTVYSTPTCPYCNMAKEWLKEKNIEFENIDVSENAEARDLMVEKSGQMGVPVIIVGEGENEQVIIGFDKEKLEAALAAAPAEKPAGEKPAEEKPSGEEKPEPLEFPGKEEEKKAA